jgi:hypothetical protein
VGNSSGDDDFFSSDLPEDPEENKKEGVSPDAFETCVGSRLQTYKKRRITY